MISNHIYENCVVKFPEDIWNVKQMWFVKTINYVFRDLITKRCMEAFSVIKKSLPRFVTAEEINLVENYISGMFYIIHFVP